MGEDKGAAAKAAPAQRNFVDMIAHPTSVAVYQVVIGAAIWVCTMLLIAVPEAKRGIFSLYPAMFKDTWTILVLLGIDLYIIYFVVSDNSTYEVIAKRKLLGLVVACLLVFALLGTFLLDNYKSSLDAEKSIVVLFAVALLFIPRAISYWQPAREKFAQRSKP